MKSADRDPFERALQEALEALANGGPRTKHIAGCGCTFRRFPSGTIFVVDTRCAAPKVARMVRAATAAPKGPPKTWDEVLVKQRLTRAEAAALRAAEVGDGALAVPHRDPFMRHVEVRYAIEVKRDGSWWRIASPRSSLDKVREVAMRREEYHELERRTLRITKVETVEVIE